MSNKIKLENAALDDVPHNADELVGEEVDPDYFDKEVD